MPNPRWLPDSPMRAVEEDPPATLEPESFAERLYLAMAPVARLDASTGWSLLKLCNAIGIMFQLLEELVRDTPEGPGWSPLLDLDRCPDEALPWLAQMVGVRLTPGSSPAEQRLRIASTDGFKRGTAAAMRGAVGATLTGARTVLFRERSGDPVAEPIDYAYYLDVTTYESQTPDPAATEAALLSQKPGGIVLSYRAVPGQTWRQLRDSGRTWAQVNSDYTSWGGVRRDEPGAPAQQAPVPVLTQLAPDSAGSWDAQVQALGSSFTPESEIVMGGSVVATSFVSTSELHFVVPASLPSGSYPVKVRTGTKESSELTFTSY